MDVASGFYFLSFMEAYFEYNQIPVHLCDAKNTAFISPMGNYYYTVMPFGLKNTEETYQRLVNKVFAEHIENLMEIYINDMLVKIMVEESLVFDLKKAFDCLW